MITRFIFFFAVGLTVLFGSHWVLYISWARFFNLTNATSRQWLGWGLALLSFSFFGASWLAHWSENWLTKWLYAGTGFWLGLLVNLFFMCIFGWGLLLVGKLIGISVPMAPFALFMAFAIGFTAYGSWNAFHPQVKDVTVTIQDLPEQWKGKTLVQLSDVHLGHVYGREFLEKLVADTNALHPDIVVITGDLFDGMDGNLATLTEPLQKLSAPLGIFLITGNHETYLGVDKVMEVLKNSPNIRVLNDEMVTLDGVQLVGIAYPDQRAGQTKDIGKTLAGIPGFQSKTPTILLHHDPVGIDAARAQGVDLQLAGHTHRGQLLPFELITRLVYHGYDYGLYQVGAYTLYTSSGVGTWGPPVRTSGQSEIVAIHLQ